MVGNPKTPQWSFETRHPALKMGLHDKNLGNWHKFHNFGTATWQGLRILLRMHRASCRVPNLYDQSRELAAEMTRQTGYGQDYRMRAELQRGSRQRDY